MQTSTHVVKWEDAEGITYREYHPSEQSATEAAERIKLRPSLSGVWMRNVRVEPVE